MSRWPFWAATNKGVTPQLSAWSLAAPCSTRKRTMSRWPFLTATNKGVVPYLSAWSLAAPCSTRRRTVSRWSLSAAANNGVCPLANSGSSHFVPASSNSSIGWTSSCSAAWNKGVLPSVSASLGSRGCCKNCSRATKSFSLDAEIILLCCFIIRRVEFQDHQLDLRWSRI